MKTKHFFFILITLLILLTAGCAAQATPTDEPQPDPTAVPVEKFTIGMATITSHPSLDQIKQGVIDKLAEAGFVDGETATILQGNAEGDMATLTTIIQQYVDEDVDIIVATTTAALQAAYTATKDLGGPPIIFNGVSNPYTAGIATAPDDHPAWVLGNQLLDPVKETMSLIKEINPAASVVGIVYNPSEANAAYLVEIAKTVAAEMGMTLELANVANTSEVQTAADTLVGRGIDAFMALSDNTVASGFEPLVQVANDNDILLVGTSASFPPRGAAASYGVNPYQEGLDSGDLVVRFLQGQLDLATTPIEIQDAVLLTVNPAAALEQGFEIPQTLLDKADSVIE
jgi:putative tryptophan/tyrosine transport system substrate-binding protein